MPMNLAPANKKSLKLLTSFSQEVNGITFIKAPFLFSSKMGRTKRDKDQTVDSDRS